MTTCQTILVILAAMNLFVAMAFIKQASVFYILKDFILFLLIVLLTYGNKIKDENNNTYDLTYRTQHIFKTESPAKYSF